jgi:hypothetical protein
MEDYSNQDVCIPTDWTDENGPTERRREDDTRVSIPNESSALNCQVDVRQQLWPKLEI